MNKYAIMFAVAAACAAAATICVSRRARKLISEEWIDDSDQCNVDMSVLEKEQRRIDESA